jgi:uroporphyrinogen III methyltransferase/synthase
MTDSHGHVWLVGAGPGDPGLLTLAGAEALRRAEVVLYDALASPALLDLCDAAARLIPVGKRAGDHTASQDEITALLVHHGSAGRRVVRLKGGDPFVFGRGGEEALALAAAGIPYTVIPGVTSAVAVPAYAGIPVTHRGMATNFAVVTGREGAGVEAGWDALARVDTLVVLMGAAGLPEISERLIAAGREPSTPAASISNGTMPAQRVVVATLATIAAEVAAAGLPTPLITVIGPVAALAGEIGWYVPGPLAGKSIVVTRARAQASQLRTMLEALGASVIEAPVLRVRFREEDLVTDERVASRWDWIAFTSQNGVEAFFAALRRAGRDARALGTTRVAAVGDATAAALERHGVVADFTPSQATGECLARELPRVTGARVLLPQGSLAGDRLADGLRARGAHIEAVVVYETHPVPLDDQLRERVARADAITFASASSARFLADALGDLRPQPAARLVAIGEQSAVAVQAAFGRVDARASGATLPGLVAAVVEALR